MCTLNNKKNTDVEMLMPKIKYNAINKIVFANYDLLDIIFNNINLQNVINQEEYKVYSDIKKYSNLENYEHNRYFNCFSKIIVPITINFSVVSIGLATESKKIEKIILKNKFKNIVIIIANWEILSSEVQDFIIILLKNKEKFIKQYSKNSITIVYGTVDTNDKLKDSFFDNVIIYNNLSIKDSLLLVQQYTEFGDISYKVFEEIFKINIGDFSKILTTLKLTKEHKYALSKNTLDKLLNNMLLEINNKICFKYTNTEKVLQLFSLFPKYFDPYEIVNIDISVDSWELEQNINILEKLFVLFKHELNGNVEYTMLLQLKNKFLYSDEIIKKELFKLYYQYLTEFFPFDFKRKIQVQVNYLKNNDEILYQYILLYDYYFINNMDFNVDFIINEFEKLNMPDINKNLFMNIVSLDYKEKYKMLSEKLYYIKNDKINAFLLKKDIEYYSANNDCNVDLRGLCDLLYELIITKNCFKGDCLMKAIYLMVLIPQYIDKFNDIEKGYFLIEEFNNLDSKSEIVQEHIMYYKNILNRKSYLFVPTDSAILKCKGTLKFFEEKKMMQKFI